MKLRADYPVYLNPTDNELIELAQSNWDTLRVMECDYCLVIGSGYGNTHETLVQLYKKHIGNGKTKERWDCRSQTMETVYVGRVPNWDPYIFFREYNIMLCNLGDVSGPDKALPSRWRREFSDERIRQFELIAQISELQYV